MEMIVSTVLMLACLWADIGICHLLGIESQWVNWGVFIANHPNIGSLMFAGGWIFLCVKLRKAMD